LPKTPKWLINHSSVMLVLLVCWVDERVFRTNEKGLRVETTNWPETNLREVSVRGGKGTFGGPHRIKVDDLSSSQSAEFTLEVCTCKMRFCGDQRG
jgi:hypothetical protein